MFSVQRFLRPKLFQTCARMRLQQMCSSANEGNPIKIVPSLEKSINEITILGRVASHPQLQGTKASPVAKFTVSTWFHQKTGHKEVQQTTEWHRISVFSPFVRDQVMRNLKKGDRVLINGRVDYGEVTTHDGRTLMLTTIIAWEVVGLRRNEKVDRTKPELKAASDTL